MYVHMCMRVPVMVTTFVNDHGNTHKCYTSRHNSRENDLRKKQYSSMHDTPDASQIIKGKVKEI